MPYEYRTESEVAQLSFNPLHNPGPICDFVPSQYKTTENLRQEGGSTASIASISSYKWSARNHEGMMTSELFQDPSLRARLSLGIAMGSSMVIQRTKAIKALAATLFAHIDSGKPRVSHGIIHTKRQPKRVPHKGKS